MAGSPDRAIRIGHISDLHLPLVEAVRPANLIGKRLLGYANLLLNRARKHKLSAFLTLMAALAEEEVDLLAITGDLSTLSLASEFAHVDGLLRKFGISPERTAVVPGNHDRYTPGADRASAFEAGSSRWLPAGLSRRDGYPRVQTIGPVAVLSLDTAVWRGPVRDAGLIDRAQLERLGRILESEAVSDRWPVVLMHHPPFARRESRLRDYLSGLEGSAAFRAVMAGRGATVLHGHLHRLSRVQLDRLDVIGVPSASNDGQGAERQLAYHVYTFTRNGMERGEIVRCWPESGTGAGRLERLSLPERMP